MNEETLRMYQENLRKGKEAKKIKDEAPWSGGPAIDLSPKNKSKPVLSHPTSIIGLFAQDGEKMVIRKYYEQHSINQSTGKTAELESDFSHGTLGKVQDEKRTGQKFLVRVTAIRKRLVDEDNLCEKYHVDLCRYAGIIPDDCAGTTKIEVGQRKAEKGEEEYVQIEVFQS